MNTGASIRMLCSDCNGMKCNLFRSLVYCTTGSLTMNDILIFWCLVLLHLTIFTVLPNSLLRQSYILDSQATLLYRLRVSIPSAPHRSTQSTNKDCLDFVPSTVKPAFGCWALFFECMSSSMGSTRELQSCQQQYSTRSILTCRRPEDILRITEYSQPRCF